MKRGNIIDEFKKVLNENRDVNLNEHTNTGKRKEGYSGIRAGKYMNVANLGFPIGDNYEIEEERRKYGEKEKEWKSFLSKHPLESDWKSSSRTYKKLKKLVRSGICPKYRHQVWMKISDAYQLRERNEGYYQSILKTHEHFPPNKGVQHDIEQDLKRTFPEHELFTGTEDGRKRMRRVLLAYSWRNPLISYCQCFNYIVGMLILHFEDEEDVFWMFVQIVEEILPSRYFDRNLRGARADNKMFNTLFSIYLPELNSHLIKDFSDIAGIFCSGWFMSLYITAFLPSVALRVWDAFFLEGPVVLYKVSLGFFKTYEQRLLKAKIGSLLDIMRNLPKAVDEKVLDKHIFHEAFGSFKEMSKGVYLEEMRKKFYLEVGREIEISEEKRVERDKKEKSIVFSDRKKRGVVKEEEVSLNQKLVKLEEETEEVRKLNEILKNENLELKKELNMLKKDD